MIKVYVAGPYSADNVIDVLKNIGRGQQICGHLFLNGFAPFCPWHDKSYVMDNYLSNMDVDKFQEFSIEWLLVSDAMFLISGWRKSKGTLKEIEVAKKHDIPIFKNFTDLYKWREKHSNTVKKPEGQLVAKHYEY